MALVKPSYKPKSDDHMANPITVACPSCGARVGELCIYGSGRPVTKVSDVHSARFRAWRDGSQKFNDCKN
jgi:hypothetical protein